MFEAEGRSNFCQDGGIRWPRSIPVQPVLRVLVAPKQPVSLMTAYSLVGKVESNGDMLLDLLCGAGGEVGVGGWVIRTNVTSISFEMNGRFKRSVVDFSSC